MEVVALVNQKGGVGKSTTAHNLGQWLKIKGHRVLFIDLDNQQNLSYTMGANGNNATSFELLSKKMTIDEAIQKTASGDLIAASPQLAESDKNIIGIDTLKLAIATIKEQYDFVILDCPPSLSILTINALIAASCVVVPCQCDIYSLQALKQLHEIIETVKLNANPSLKVSGILITRYNKRAILSRDLSEAISAAADKMGSKVFESQIREAIAIKEAQAVQSDIFTYSPRSGAAKDYERFASEFFNITKC